MRAERAGILPEGAVVQIEEGPGYDPRGNDWYLVTFDGVTGWVAGDLLDAAAAPGAEEPDPAPEPEPAPAVVTAVTGQAMGSFVAPLSGYVITQYYGCSPFAFEPYDPAIGCNFHNGIDLAAGAYTPLVAADGGVVTYAGWCDCGLGFYVEIDHGNGFATVYGHMAEQPYVATGQAVARGQVIGPLGSSGLSTGPHVHFMVKLGGGTVDPLGYVAL
jgi:murein DD-endopeptidase MepM/ murein hydrolase activator NlpD